MGVALEELRIATAADPSYAPAHSLLGLVYMELREESLAEQSFERALRLAPNDGDINHNYGLFLCQTKREPDVDQVLHAGGQAIRSMPRRGARTAPPGCAALRTEQRRRRPSSISSARCACSPTSPQALLNLGQIRYQQGKHRRGAHARRALQQARRRRAPSRCGSRCASSASRASASPSRATPTSCGGASRARAEYQALQRGKFD